MKLLGTLPKGEGNGLAIISEQMIEAPDRVFAVVALVDCKKTTTDYDSGDVVPHARIRHIEVVQGDEHVGLLRKIMRRSLGKRTGREVLPLNLEDEITEAFKGVRVDTTTGEVLDVEDDDR